MTDHCYFRYSTHDHLRALYAPPSSHPFSITALSPSQTLPYLNPSPIPIPPSSPTMHHPYPSLITASPHPSLITTPPHLFIMVQEYEAQIKQFEVNRTRVEQEEKRKTLAAETKQHQEVGLCALLAWRFSLWYTHIYA